MKKLVVFGDSFADPFALRMGCNDKTKWFDILDDRQYTTNTWSKTLADALGIPCFNYAVCGSSIEFSLIKFYEYQKSSDYDENDIIIFTLTSPERIATEFSTRNVPYAGTWIHHKPHYNSAWYESSKKYFEWLLVNTPNELLDIKIPMTIGFLQSWANNHHSKGKMVLIPCFGTFVNGTSFDDVQDITNRVVGNTSNSVFLNSNLFSASRKEFTLEKDCITTIQKFRDFRTNHFSLANHEILKNMLYEVIDTMNPDRFDNDKFVQGIYTSAITNEKDLKPYLDAKIFQMSY